MITGLPVYFNGEKLIVKDLSKYARMFFPDPKNNSLMSFTAPNGDECVIIEGDIPTMEEIKTEHISHVSFFNGIFTKYGGVHVDTWVKAIFPRLVKSLNARNPPKGKKEVLHTEGIQVYPYFVVFVRTESYTVPRFDSQAKDKLTFPTPVLVDPEDKKATASWSETLNAGITKMLKWNFVSLLDAKLEARAELKGVASGKVIKKNTTLGGKCIHANNAGKKGLSRKCVGCITEGDSAQTFCNRGAAALDLQDWIGSMPIKGKFKSAKKWTTKEMLENVEVQCIIKFFGLRLGVDYTSEEEYDTLKYGHAEIFSDADDDGIHICGLLLIFFDTFWPSLTKRGFVQSRSTAVVKVEACKKGSTVKETFLHYSTLEHSLWMASVGQNMKIGKNDIKYYKGLGTHRGDEVSPYFEDPRTITYTPDVNGAESLDLGFSDEKHIMPKKKVWITEEITKPGCLPIRIANPELPIIQGPMSFTDFVRKKLIIYHRASLVRAIPSLYDGFKESTRKAFFSIIEDAELKQKSLDLEKVMGTIKRKTGYHHGASSIYGLLINMARGYVGTNNIPLLVNAGEFGSRSKPDDNAAPRYIETMPEKIAFSIFLSIDEPLLENNYDGKTKLEPKFYLPIIPMILINGGDGIGCGFSTGVPPYNPDDVVTWIECWLDLSQINEDDMPDLPPMKPWFRGFKGEIELVADPSNPEVYTGWKSKGILEKDPDPKSKWWHIHEAPIGLWTNKLMMHIDHLMTGDPLPTKSKSKTKGKKEKGEVYIKDYKQYNSANSVHVTFEPTADFIPDMTVKDNFKILQTSEPLTNMYLLDENGYPRKYASPEDILLDFCKFRLRYYEKRRAYYLYHYEQDKIKLESKIRFVKAVGVDKTLDMYHEDADLEREMMETHKLVKIDDKFDYLLSMQIRSCTVKRVEELEKEYESIQSKLTELKTKSARDLWKDDLTNFRVSYKTFLTTRKEEVLSTKNKKKGAKK
jgi:DNA topoisomerase-2